MHMAKQKGKEWTSLRLRLVTYAMLKRAGRKIAKEIGEEKISFDRILSYLAGYYISHSEEAKEVVKSEPQ